MSEQQDTDYRIPPKSPVAPLADVVRDLAALPLEEVLDGYPDPTSSPQEADCVELLRAAIAFRNVGTNIVGRLEDDAAGKERDQ